MPRDLHVTSPHMRGPDVKALQERLAKLGYAVGITDSVYGPTTAGAVRAFQRDHKLEVDGWVGPRTFEELEKTTKPAEPAVPSGPGVLALAEAALHIDVKEDPPGSNKTIFGAWYGLNGYAWCNMFVSYCFVKGANYIIADGFKGAGVRAGKGCAYVPTTEAWLRATGMWIGRVAPLPGDIAIYNWDGREPDHIGIVSKDLGGGAFEAIEGNTGPSDFSNGGMVMRCVRHLHQVNGFGRVIV